MLTYILLTAGILTGWGGAWLVIRYGHLWGFIDHPNHRSSHKKATPKGGGVGILAAFLIAAISTFSSWSIWLPVALLSILSLYGDRLHLSQKLRLVVQFICAGIFVWFAAPNNYTAVSSSSGIPAALIIPAFILMITASANYYNFMDAINGIAGITGTIAFLALGFIAKSSGAHNILLICIAITGACIGFLMLNMRGKVFMGDGGSILLGFLFAGIAILLSENLLDIFCYFAFIFPFYADEFISILIRLRNKQTLFKPHRGHLCQLLANELGITHWKISIIYGIFQLAIIILIMKIRTYGLGCVIGFEFLLLLAFGGCYTLAYKAIKQNTSVFSQGK